MSQQPIFDTRSIQEQIPYYLTQPQKVSLAQALSDFPDVGNYFLSRPTQEIQDSMLQGDIFTGLPIYGEQGSKTVRGIILSNSCDIDASNSRDIPAKALFAPLIDLSKFISILESSGKTPEAIGEKLKTIREQKITNIIYLPENEQHPESIAFLDDLYNLHAKNLKTLLDAGNKVVSLSQVGFYIFVFKLSVHFCRFHEAVGRYDH